MLSEISLVLTSSLFLTLPKAECCGCCVSKADTSSIFCSELIAEILQRGVVLVPAQVCSPPVTDGFCLWVFAWCLRACSCGCGWVHLCVSACLFVCLFVCLFGWFFGWLVGWLVGFFVCLSVFLLVCLFVRWFVFVCLLVCSFRRCCVSLYRGQRGKVLNNQRPSSEFTPLDFFESDGRRVEMAQMHEAVELGPLRRIQV